MGILKFIQKKIEPLAPFVREVAYKGGIFGKKNGQRLQRFRLFWKINTDSDIRELFQHLSFERKLIEEYKTKKIKDILNYAYNYVPFYKELYKENDFHPDDFKSFEDIDKIPVLSKNSLKQAVKDKKIFSTEKKRWRVSSAETTGSTGVPTKVYIDKHAKKIRRFAQHRAFMLNDLWPGDSLVKVWRDKGVGVMDVIGFFFGTYLSVPVMEITDVKRTALGEKKLDGILKKIENYKPKVIRGYVSALYVLAKYYKKNKNKYNINPKIIMGSAENLPPAIWDELEETFDCKVINFYGGSEVSPIATSTRFSRDLIVFEDVFHVDLIDKEEKTIEKGVGSVLVTDLHNKYMPIIRYEIGDIAEWGENYQLGFKTFKEVKGRKIDVFVLPGGKVVFAELWCLFFIDEEWVNKFRVIQEDIDFIRVLIEPVGEVDEKSFERLKEGINSSFGKEIKIKYEIVDKIPLDKGDKFRYVISKVDIKK